jgi:UDP-2-acetamido-2-deoxy-ribo-hexuluronate aminotransferase
MGPVVRDFEAQLAEFVGVDHCISCSSGTDAIVLALLALGVGSGDEVIIPTLTFIATAEAVATVGARPVFIDVKDDCLLDCDALSGLLTDKTKAIIAVSLYGQLPDFDVLSSFAKVNGLFLIEDAAQSMGAQFKGKNSCSIADVSCTSFFPAKPLGCYGDGGAVFTNDLAVANKMTALRVHGQSRRFYHDYIGINGRLDAIQAGVLIVKLKYFKDELEKRQVIAQRYLRLLSAVPGLFFPDLYDQRVSVFAQFVIRVRQRDELAVFLKEQGIDTGVHYPLPLHLQTCFVDLGYKVGDLPRSEKICEEIISLPMSAFLTLEQQDIVVSKIQEFYD